MMMVGHVVGGLALFGGSVLAAAVAVTLAGMSGMRHLRKLVSGLSFPVVQQDGSRYTDVAEPGGQRLHQRRATGSQRVHRGSLTSPRQIISFPKCLRSIDQHS
jgi:hypothetical protein